VPERQEKESVISLSYSRVFGDNRHRRSVNSRGPLIPRRAVAEDNEAKAKLKPET